MFDDIPNANQPTPPVNLPTEPEDMFAGNASPDAIPNSPNAIAAGVLKPKNSASDSRPAGEGAMVGKLASGGIAPSKPPAPIAPIQAAVQTQSPTMYTVKEPILGKIILIVVFGSLLVGLGYGVWWFYKNVVNNPGAALPVVDTVQNEFSDSPDSSSDEQPSVAFPATDTNITGEDVNRQMKNDEILFGEPIDTDSDGLDDQREGELKTNPNVADTDRDGLNDGDEVLIWKTNPLNPDTDGDGYSDGKEVYNGYDPLGPGKLNLLPGVTTSTTASPVAK